MGNGSVKSGVGSSAMVLGWFGFVLLVIVTVGLLVMILSISLIRKLTDDEWSDWSTRILKQHHLLFVFAFYDLLLLLLHLRHTPLIAGRHKWEMNNTYELTTKLTIHGMDGNGTWYLGHLDFQWENTGFGQLWIFTNIFEDLSPRAISLPMIWHETNCQSWESSHHLWLFCQSAGICCFSDIENNAIELRFCTVFFLCWCLVAFFVVWNFVFMLSTRRSIYLMYKTAFELYSYAVFSCFSLANPSWFFDKISES